ncbi:hypothetical protein TIFTF001_030569 [Ficus carica]|uniref:Uncharacterized protein n=1 Tax=Ficus carica TaxID=3494 RepID=A0AA88DXS8_FICCA|nr:hypothetical protein TIFTF001_030569 [Ficus carica]
MKKKNVKVDKDSVPVVDLKSIIHQHSLFFDKLVELIPAKFYLPTDDKDKPWFQGLSKAEKASAKKETKENIKKARRNRLDPEKSSTTTLDLLKQSLEKEKQDYASDDDDETETRPNFTGLDDDNRSVTYEELKQRLHRRIEEFRATRNTGGSEKASKRNERNDKKGIEQKKRKRDNESKEKEAKAGNSDDKVERDVIEASKELTFSHVKLGNEDEYGKKKKKKLSKMLELERAKKLEEAKKDPEKGDVISKKHSWKAATSRAAGIKVHDDPKLLKQSIQKEKRRQQKNAQRWKERVQTTQKMKAERQQKRSENIAAKKHDKKMRKIAKREKKLMRPGFEGRKEGFVNEDTA